jgi:hypothetical protein
LAIASWWHDLLKTTEPLLRLLQKAKTVEWLPKWCVFLQSEFETENFVPPLFSFVFQFFWKSHEILCEKVSPEQIVKSFHIQTFPRVFSHTESDVLEKGVRETTPLEWLRKLFGESLRGKVRLEFQNEISRHLWNDCNVFSATVLLHSKTINTNFGGCGNLTQTFAFDYQISLRYGKSVHWMYMCVGNGEVLVFSCQLFRCTFPSVPKRCEK